MRTSKKNNKNTSSEKKAKQISNVVKPSKLASSYWQIQLRQQIAGKENFSISQLSAGEFTIVNYTTKLKYNVVWRGEGHPLNSCSCMDYKTSRVGTCKHIEAVKQWRGTKKDVVRPVEVTTLYVDYSSNPRLRIHSAG